MAKKPQQSRSQAKAASKSRPAATFQPSSTSAPLSTLTAFCPFSPHFAILTQAIDRHRLTVYSTSTGGSSRLLVDYILPSSSSGGESSQGSRCSAICWVRIPSSPSPAPANDSPQAKRQKKGGRGSLTAADNSNSPSSFKSSIALGLESGQVHLFDVAQGKVTEVLTQGSSIPAAITSLAFPVDAASYKLYAAAKDGVVTAWSLEAAAASSHSTASTSSSSISPAVRVTLHSSSPNTLVSVSPSASHLLLANHTITRVEESTSTAKCSYASHASSMTHLTWIDDEHFVSAAQGDPVLYVWKASRSKSPIGTIELEQAEDVVRIYSRAAVVVVVGSQGFVGIYDTAALVTGDAPQAKGTKLIKPTSTSTSSSSLVDVRLDDTAERLDLARLIKGVKLDLCSTQIKDPATSSILSTLSIPKASSQANLLASGDDDLVTKGNSSLQRYSDATPTAGKQSGETSSNAPVGADGLLIQSNGRFADDDDAALNKEAGGIDDERTLEDRLRGLRVIRKATKAKKSQGDGDVSSDSDVDDDDDDVEGSATASRSNAPNTSISLATSLSQALHSSDTSLISSLLTSANPELIKGTVLRISGPNAVLLLEACVARLNSSKRGPQKARGMVEWIKWTLRLHAGYLMSLPGLTSRLASLHSSLNSRLTGYERMLALQGRLELVLGQIELRSDYDVVKAKIQGASSATPSVSATRGKKTGIERIEKEANVWKEDEDESDEEEEEEEVVAEGMDVDDDSDDDEDVSDSDSDDDDEEDDDDDDGVEVQEDEGDVEDVGLDSRLNGFSTTSASTKKAKGGVTAAASSDEEDDNEEEDDEDDIVRPASRRVPKVKKSGKSPAHADISALSGGATSDESADEDEDESMEDEEEEDEDDESDLLDEDDDDDEDDDEDDDGEGGFIDDEAEEASDDEEEEDESSEEE